MTLVASDVTSSLGIEYLKGHIFKRTIYPPSLFVMDFIIWLQIYGGGRGVQSALPLPWAQTIKSPV